MINLCDVPTISETEIVETLNTFEQQGLKDEVLTVVYEFASVRTGRIIDFLMHQTGIDELKGE